MWNSKEAATQPQPPAGEDITQTDMTNEMDVTKENEMNMTNETDMTNEPDMTIKKEAGMTNESLALAGDMEDPADGQTVEVQQIAQPNHSQPLRQLTKKREMKL